jgi:hypothetical protein
MEPALPSAGNESVADVSSWKPATPHHFRGSHRMLFEEEFVSDGFAYFDEFSKLAERKDAVKQRVSFIVEFLLEAKSANGYTDFHSFSIA